MNADGVREIRGEERSIQNICKLNDKNVMKEKEGEWVIKGER